MSETPVPKPFAAAGDPQTAGPTAASVTAAIPPTCPTRTRLYRSGRVVAEGFPAEELSSRLTEDPDAVAWLDLDDPDLGDMQIVTDEFGLHPLAVEDAVHEHQRPNLDRYRSHQFMTVYAARTDPATSSVQLGEVSVFLTPRALITVRKTAFDIDAVQARWDAGDQRLAAAAPIGYLLHGLLDGVVDGHLAATSQLERAADEVEDQLFEAVPELDVRRRAFEVRKSLGLLRRVVGPMHELVVEVTAVDGLVSEDLRPYYADVEGHALRSAEACDRLRDLIANVLDTNLNEQSYRQNEITKKLAAWAAIIAVPTAVTGYYGQNVPYPGFSQRWGFVSSALIIVVLAVGLYVLLRRRGWL